MVSVCRNSVVRSCSTFNLSPDHAILIYCCAEIKASWPGLNQYLRSNLVVPLPQQKKVSIRRPPTTLFLQPILYEIGINSSAGRKTSIANRKSSTLEITWYQGLSRKRMFSSSFQVILRLTGRHSCYICSLSSHWNRKIRVIAEKRVDTGSFEDFSDFFWGKKVTCSQLQIQSLTLKHRLQVLRRSVDLKFYTTRFQRFIVEAMYETVAF